MKKKNLITIIIVLIFVATIFWMYQNNNSQKSQTNDNINQISTSTNSTEVKYVNQEYGFQVLLPENWLGFTSTTTEWQGFVTDPNVGDVVSTTGPEFHIYDPAWTKDNPRQGIPVMVFTLVQWNLLQRGKFHIGAAPINPSKFSNNSQYVFALPARYNFASLPGFKEVEEILKGNPVQPLDMNSPLTANDKVLLCGGIPDGSTMALRDTSRIFINLPREVYPNKDQNLVWKTINGKTTSGYISNAGKYGEAFEATPECFSYYQEFDGVGKIDLHVKSTTGQDDYLVHFIITKAD